MDKFKKMTRLGVFGSMVLALSLSVTSSSPIAKAGGVKDCQSDCAGEAWAAIDGCIEAGGDPSACIESGINGMCACLSQCGAPCEN